MSTRPWIYIYNSALALQGVIANYHMLEFTRAWNTPGGFEFEINLNTPDADKCVVDNIVYVDGDRVGWIMAVDEVRDAGGKATEAIRVSGIEIKDIPAFRVTALHSGAKLAYTSDAPETIIKDLIDKSLGSSAIADRQLSIVTVAADSALGTAVDFSTLHKNLLDEIFALLVVDELGLEAAVDLSTTTLTFDVAEGVDRRASQSANTRVMLSLDMGSLLKIQRKTDTSNYKNYAYVGGQGEGEDRTIVGVGTATGAARREMFVDARDIATTDELAVRGAVRLAELSSTAGITCLIRSTAYTYLTDYDRGDYVTLIDDALGISTDVQIMAVREKWTAGKTPEISAIFGFDPEGPASIAQILKGKFGEATPAITQGSGAIPSVIDNLTSTSTTDALSAKQGKVLNGIVDLAANGYCKFPNGLIIQWGAVSITPVANTPTSADVTLPTAFTSTNYTAVPNMATSAPYTIGRAASILKLSASQIRVVFTRTDTTATNINWIAIGY